MQGNALSCLGSGIFSSPAQLSTPTGNCGAGRALAARLRVYRSALHRCGINSPRCAALCRHGQARARRGAQHAGVAAEHQPNGGWRAGGTQPGASVCDAEDDEGNWQEFCGAWHIGRRAGSGPWRLSERRGAQRGRQPFAGRKAPLHNSLPAVTNSSHAAAGERIHLHRPHDKNNRLLACTDQHFTDRLCPALCYAQLLADVYIFTDHMTGPQAGASPGYGVTLVAETTSGRLIAAEAVAATGGAAEVRPCGRCGAGALAWC